MRKVKQAGKAALVKRSRQSSCVGTIFEAKDIRKTGKALEPHLSNISASVMKYPYATYVPPPHSQQNP